MKVYLDMDGVIADFFTDATKYANSEHAHWRDMEFRDVERALKKIRKTTGFFLGLPAFSMANTLVQSIVNITGECRILTSPLQGYSTCEEEKRQWLDQNIHYSFDEVIVATDKTKYAYGNVLIDDYGYNVRRWESAGGYGIKYQADEQHISDVITPLNALFKNQL